jgi:hypothetical protein
VPAKFNGEVLGSKAFADKRALLLGAGYPLEPEIAKAASWGAPEIAARTVNLAEYAYAEVWAIK